MRCGEAALDDRNAWIEARLTAALNATKNDVHEFPPALTDELHRLLAEALQYPCKQSELEKIADRLIAANRSKA